MVRTMGSRARLFAWVRRVVGVVADASSRSATIVSLPVVRGRMHRVHLRFSVGFGNQHRAHLHSMNRLHELLSPQLHLMGWGETSMMETKKVCPHPVISSPMFERVALGSSRCNAAVFRLRRHTSLVHAAGPTVHVGKSTR